MQNYRNMKQPPAVTYTRSRQTQQAENKIAHTVDFAIWRHALTCTGTMSYSSNSSLQRYPLQEAQPDTLKHVHITLTNALHDRIRWSTVTNVDRYAFAGKVICDLGR